MKTYHFRYRKASYDKKYCPVFCSFVQRAISTILIKQNTFYKCERTVKTEHTHTYLVLEQKKNGEKRKRKDEKWGKY